MIGPRVPGYVVHSIVGRHDAPRVLLGHGDLEGAQVEFAIDAGFDVPHEIAVMGCDNDDLYLDVSPVPLSSVDSEVERCGYQFSDA